MANCLNSDVVRSRFEAALDRAPRVFEKPWELGALWCQVMDR
ncbi:MAG: hypothetical protein ACFCVB_20625 [Nodosilinea sp.]